MKLIHKKHRFTFLTLLLTLLCTTYCGDGDVTITIEFANGSGITQTSNPFTDPAVADVIFIVTSQAPVADVVDSFGNVVIEAGKILDRNEDGIADSLIYPEDCANLTTFNCGFQKTAANFNLTGVPLNYQYIINVRFRSNTGVSLYDGSTAAFNNIISTTGAVILTVNKVP